MADYVIKEKQLIKETFLNILIKDARAGWPCASVLRKLGFCLWQIHRKKPIKIISIKYAMCNIHITFLNISSILIRILSCFIVISHIIYFTT